MHHIKSFKRYFLTLLLSLTIYLSHASYILIPMDQNQTNHLKAYGIAFLAIQNEISINWLLNYKGGSFLIKNNELIENECNIRGVLYNIIADLQSSKPRNYPP